MWLLGRVLPLIIGDYLPEDDEHWLLFLQMIVDLLFSPALSQCIYFLLLVTIIMIFAHYILIKQSSLKCTLWCICQD